MTRKRARWWRVIWFPSTRQDDSATAQLLSDIEAATALEEQRGEHYRAQSADLVDRTVSNDFSARLVLGFQWNTQN